jgi:hypothetical protein
LQCGAVREISLDEGDTEVGKVCRLQWVSNQRTYPVAPLQQALAQGGTDKTGGAGYGNKAAFGDQAEATLRRTSSAAASSISTSLLLMKSRRALARDSLPEDVRGSE